jgi:hypothetical protein
VLSNGCQRHQMSTLMVGKTWKYVSYIGFYVKQILRIIGSQIEIERIFSLDRIHISFRRCHLQLENLDKLIFVNKNWPNDFKIDYKSPFRLVELIETDVNLEEEFE